MTTSAKTPSLATEHVSVSQVRRSVRKAIAKREWGIQGECVAPVQSGAKWNFDLVTLTADGVSVLSCTIWEDRAPGIEDSLRRAGLSLQQAMTAGMVLKLTGTTWLAQDGKVSVRVTGIEPEFARRGALYLADRAAKAELRAAGVPSERLGELFVHADPETVFQGMDRRPSRIMVLAPAGAKGVGDFKHRFRDVRSPAVDIAYRALSWTDNSSIQTIQAHLDEAHQANTDLVVLIRGGGPWSHLRGYDRVDLALAIHRSPVPVATAVGHNADVSLADRAAKLSFITPTAAAEAIYKAHSHRAPRKKSARTGATHYKRKPVHTAWTVAPGARPADATNPEKQLQALEGKLVDALEDASKLAATLQWSAAAHIADLLETAEQRVRFISRLMTVATVTTATALIAFGEDLLALLQPAPRPLDYWLYAATVILAGTVLVVRQSLARRKIALPSAAPMKRPHVAINSWRFAAKRVRTIRGLRKLRYHRPA
ncbi:exodeoxyribonuclease VII large subunit [Arthrobacter sp. NPDC057009]|uniref:exodeoxyribonuclease VII large subunit n=1 Tax=Arthrobacter sp. NPDC057009 TaxID=3345996 RepID=UPI0036258116